MISLKFYKEFQKERMINLLHKLSLAKNIFKKPVIVYHHIFLSEKLVI